MLLLAVGSRGDVQPLAVLAGALRRAGVDARVAALREFAGLVEGHGAPFVGIEAGLADALDSARTPLGRLATRSPAGQGVLLNRWTARLAPAVADAVLGALRPGEAVLTGVLSRDVATALAEGDGRRVATIVYTGQLPTLHRDSHYFASWFGPWPAYNAWGGRFNWRVASNVGAPLGREVRRRLGLAAPGAAAATAAADRHPVVVAASPVLVPPAPDWPAGVHETGYLAPPEGAFAPDADLAAFLAGGEAVYVGFGSFTGSSGRDSLAALGEAATLAGRRLVTPALPGGRAGRVAERLFATGPVPHGRLFARCAAVVHHGGAGTTQAGLRAGVPSAAVPFGVDQPYHAWRLWRLGVSPEPVPIRRLTPERLAGLIGELTSGPAAAGYRRRAAELGAVLSAEDGVARTVELVARLGLT